LRVLHIANKIVTCMRKILGNNMKSATRMFLSLCLMERSVLSILNETTIVVFVSTVQLKGVSEQAAAEYHSKRFCPMARRVLQCVFCCKVTTHLRCIYVLLMEK
jgi:hypothetical protein